MSTETTGGVAVGLNALLGRLRDHADCHAAQDYCDAEQQQWRDDLREAAAELERMSCLLHGLPIELRLRAKMYIGKKSEAMKDAAAILDARIGAPNSELRRVGAGDQNHE